MCSEGVEDVRFVNMNKDSKDCLSLSLLVCFQSDSNASKSCLLVIDDDT